MNADTCVSVVSYTESIKIGSTYPFLLEWYVLLKRSEKIGLNRIGNQHTHQRFEKFHSGSFAKLLIRQNVHDEKKTESHISVFEILSLQTCNSQNTDEGETKHEKAK